MLRKKDHTDKPTIPLAEIADVGGLACLRSLLWPKPAACRLTEGLAGELIGLAEVGLRPCRRVRSSVAFGYLGGRFVEEGGRRHGDRRGRAVSQRAHEALGFAVVHRWVNYREELRRPAGAVTPPA